MNRTCRSMLANLISLLGLHIVLIAPVWAQAPAVPGPPSDGAIGGIVAAVAILCLLVVIGVAVKLVDVKRNHEDEAAALQARISDALMMDRSLSGLTLTPVVQMPFRRGGLTSLTINGVVPTPELREAAIRLIMRTLEQAQASCRVEDRIVVDPTMIKHAA